MGAVAPALVGIRERQPPRQVVRADAHERLGKELPTPRIDSVGVSPGSSSLTVVGSGGGAGRQIDGAAVGLAGGVRPTDLELVTWLMVGENGGQSRR